MANTLNCNNTRALFPDLPAEPYKTGIVHLGLGAFHRAHQALITDECIQKSGNNNWGILAANIRSGRKLVEHMQAQDNLYTVTETNPDGTSQCKVISSITDALYAGNDDQTGVLHRALLNRMSHPSIRIVSLTVTEKGYGLSACGELLLDNPTICHDLTNPEQPHSAIGLIVAALAIRRQNKLKPFTVLSCDNIPENGLRTRNAVLQLARHQSEDLTLWIDKHCAFPSTMVDRIVPAMTEENLKQVQSSLGVRDNCAIVCESFCQWVIEDNFVDGTNGRPPWELATGVSLVADVRPWEEMKLRILNGAHSFLAYTGYLGGMQTISEVMQSPHYVWAVRSLMLNEAAPTLRMPKDYDLDAYTEQLLQRFSNPTLAHQTQQIAMDGSQKIPQRWLNTIRWHLQHNSDFPMLALSLAAWVQYVSGTDEQSNIIEVVDPQAEKLHLLLQAYGDNIGGRTRALLADKTLFGNDLSTNNRFIATVVYYAEELHDHGVIAMLARLYQTGN